MKKNPKAFGNFNQNHLKGIEITKSTKYIQYLLLIFYYYFVSITAN